MIDLPRRVLHDAYCAVPGAQSDNKKTRDSGESARTTTVLDWAGSLALGLL